MAQEELEPFLAPEVDQVWAGLWVSSLCPHTLALEVPQKGGTTSWRVQEAFGMLWFSQCLGPSVAAV